MQIVLASNNAGKVREFQQMLADKGLEVVAQSHFNIPSVPETGTTFVENAIIKARHACKLANCPAIADDSGIEVDALNGAPGVYSARFAGENARDADNNAKLVELLTNVPEAERTARYHCLLVYMRHAEDPTPLICHGTFEGRVQLTPRGENGFGYDPHFFVPDLNCTAAELTPEVKNAISHRGKAMAALLAAL